MSRLPSATNGGKGGGGGGARGWSVSLMNCLNSDKPDSQTETIYFIVINKREVLGLPIFFV